MKKRIIVPRLAALLGVLFAFAFSGCEKREESRPIPPRLSDPAYRETLKKNQAEQRKLNKARFATEARLEVLIAQARKALPKGSSDEQVKAELNDHPEKYPMWKKLYAQAETNVAASAATIRAAREAVRAKILKEQARKQSGSQQKK